jgi:glycerophosphoryl diester phosphodiesterase
MHPYLDHDGPIPFAHRGGASEAPENTMSAFEDAIALGYRYIETDVHATSDGVLVAFHDNDLSRTCNRPGRISQMTWAELQTVRVHQVERIPLFVDLIHSFPEAKINIDCKSEHALRPLIETLTKERCLSRVCIGSFSDRRLRQIRSEFQSEVCTSLGPSQVARLLLASKTAPKIAKSLGGLVAQIPIQQFGIHLTTSKLIATAKDMGIPIHVWTIDDEPKMNELLDLNVDGIMTDRTRLLKEVFQRRHLWYT